MWNKFDHPRPYVTVSGFAVDDSGRFPILHRSDKVRSAKDCWALPSGLHEVGISMADQFSVELFEELGLRTDSDATPIGVYENIAHVDQWHWTIVVLAVRVPTLDGIVNREVDKHDKMSIVTLPEAVEMIKTQSHGKWGPLLGEFIVDNQAAIRAAISKVICRA